jgi:hypothetical protein
MAEVLACSSRIIYLLHFTQTVNDYIQHIKAPPEEAKKVIESLSSVFFDISALKNQVEQEEWPGTIKSLSVPNGPFDQLALALETMVGRFATTGEGFKKASKPLFTWPFQKDETVALLSRIERQTSLLHLALKNDPKYVNIIFCELF